MTGFEILVQKAKSCYNGIPDFEVGGICRFLLCCIERIHIDLKTAVHCTKRDNSAQKIRENI
jgi:hypothetical protein